MNRVTWVIYGLVFALVARREFFLRGRDVSNYAVVDSYAFAEIVIVALSLLFVVAIPSLLKLFTAAQSTSFFVFAIFFGWAMLLGPFSANANYSIFFAGEWLSQIMLIYCLIASSPDHETRIKRLIFSGSMVALITVSLRFSALGFSGSLLDYKNNVAGAAGAILAVFSFVCFTNDTYSRGLRKVLIAGQIIGFGTVVITTSAASIISVCFGISLAAFISGRSRAPLLLLVFSTVVLGVIFPDRSFAILFPGKDMNEVRTLHGRTQFWDDGFETVLERPYIGYGYAMAAKVGRVRGTNMHNSFLSIAIGNGFVGSSLFLIGLLMCHSDCRRIMRYRIPGGVACYTAIATALLNANTLSIIGEDWRGASYLFVAVWALISVSALSIRVPTSSFVPRSIDNGMRS